MFPILSIYAYNMHELSISHMVLPLVSSLGITLVTFLLSWLIIKNAVKAALIVSIFLVLFFSYGHIANLIEVSGVYGADSLLLLLFVPLLVIGICLTIRTRKELWNLTTVLNVVAVVLVLIPSINILYYELKRPSSTAGGNNSALTVNGPQTNTPPDIYYIILDGYARADTLKDFYGFDNSEFVNYLSSRGFYIASNSHSNYNITTHSIPSSLNMEFVNYLSDQVGNGTTDVRPLTEICLNNKVGQFLKSTGYKYIQVESYWLLTGPNKLADIEFTPFPVTEFNQLIYRTTMLRAFPSLAEKFGFSSDPRVGQWKCAVNQFEYLGKIPDMRKEINEPIFVFAHVVIPHVPFAVDQDGGFVTREEETSRTIEENYLNQIIFCNAEVETLVDNIIANSQVPPIIVVQGDHGAGTWGLSNWKNLSEEDQIRVNMRILNAYYLPQGGNDLLYNSITPVNTFRIIFDFYLGATYELLPDESYMSSLETPYIFREVTDIIKHD